MARRTAFPFLTIPENVVSCDGFLIGDPDTPLEPADSILENWDYARDLSVGLDLELDVQAAAQHLDIPADELKLAVRLTAGTGTGRMPRSRMTVAETTLEDGTTRHMLRGDVASGWLSGRLLLEATIMLAESPSAAGPLSPMLEGARLWEHSKDILLEGGGESRFPIETRSFGAWQYLQNSAFQNAPWFFYWRPEAWNADFSAATCLYINSDHPGLEDRVVEGDPLTLQAIMADVMSQLIEFALEMEDGGVFEEEWEEGTLGAQLRNWSELAFPGWDTETIDAVRDHKPGEFRAAILTAASVED